MTLYETYSNIHSTNLTMNKFVNFKNILNTAFASGLLIAAGSIGASSVNATVNHSNPTAFHIIVDGGAVKDFTVQGLNEGLSANGNYTVTYRFTYPSRDMSVSFPTQTQLHRCEGGNGNTSGPYAGIACVDPNMQLDSRQVSLNAGNNYTQDVTFNIGQNPAKACGAFQTDLFAPNSNNQFITGSLFMSGVNCNQPTPTPTATPTPTPSPSASTVQCPVGKVSKVVNSTVICVSQNQNQNQNQTQNNDQNQNVNQNVTANGGSSSSSSSSSSSVNLTINNPTPTPAASTTTTTVVYTQTVPQVVAQTKGDVTELPKTGLPLAALALGGLVPGGVVFKRFGKKNVEESANDIWVERQLNS